MIGEIKTDIESILIRDACYLAVGTLAPRLVDNYINFPIMYKGTLTRDLQVTDPKYQNLRY